LYHFPQFRLDPARKTKNLAMRALCPQRPTMDASAPSCPVCGESDRKKVRKVVVEGREIYLCRTHAGVVVRAKPQSFEQLRGLFRDEQTGDRRSCVPRRDSGRPDRRFFPRPEGRRASGGRRATDPQEG